MNPITHQTRRSSYDEKLPSIGSDQWKIYEVILHYGAKTSREIAPFVPEIEHQDIKSRLSEMVTKGTLAVVGKKFYQPTNREIAVYAIPATNFSKDGQGFLFQGGM